ncbi:hypothetical protein HWV62_34249 [Athelia sp. TMB]|nr:hypothetical protein HWV62_34249 [Athelia sp. TMB]
MPIGYRTSDAQQPAPDRSFDDEEHYDTPNVPYTSPQAPYNVPRPRYESPYASPPPISAPRPLAGQPYASRFDEHEALAPAAASETDFHYGGPDRGMVGRTPSPTPSELAALEEKKMFNWKTTFSLERKNWPRLAIVGAVLVVIIVFAVLHDRIIKALQPAANWAHDTKGGFLIPIGLLFILSFPPLFGAEFVAILCGVVWGAGVGFLIVIAGQFLGEVANYFAFKYACSARSEALKKKNITYAALGRAIEDGGLLIAVTARYSIIPTHATTALFATCGMRLWVFLASAVLSLPKNFVNVYVGSTFEAEEQGKSTTASKAVNYATLALTAVVTVVAMRYIDTQINRVKPEVVRERRRARKSVGGGGGPSGLYQEGGEDMPMGGMGRYNE